MNYQRSLTYIELKVKSKLSSFKQIPVRNIKVIRKQTKYFISLNRCSVPLRYRIDIRTKRTLLWPHRGKSWRTDGILFNYLKVYLQLQFAGSHWEKEREYGSWVQRVSSAKRNNVSWWEKRTDTDLEFFSWFPVEFPTCLSAGRV